MFTNDQSKTDTYRAVRDARMIHSDFDRIAKGKRQRKRRNGYDASRSSVETLLEGHEGMILKIAVNAMLSGADTPLEDLFHQGVLGLLEAAERYKKKKNWKAKFSTYAYNWVKSYILSNKAVCEVSLEDDYEGEHKPILDTIPAKDMPVDKIAEVNEMWSLVDTLPEKMRAVMRMRYHHDMTLQQVGNIMDLTRERVRQIEVDAIESIRLKISLPSTTCLSLSPA